MLHKNLCLQLNYSRRIIVSFDEKLGFGIAPSELHGDALQMKFTNEMLHYPIYKVVPVDSMMGDAAGFWVDETNIQQ